MKEKIYPVLGNSLVNTLSTVGDSCVKKVKSKEIIMLKL